MTYITEKEVLRLATLARLKVEPEEAARLAKEIEPVLEYASILSEIAQHCTLSSESLECDFNVMREDEVVPFDSEQLLAQAPQREDSYFVVPRIIKRN